MFTALNCNLTLPRQPIAPVHDALNVLAAVERGRYENYQLIDQARHDEKRAVRGRPTLDDEVHDPKFPREHVERHGQIDIAPFRDKV